MFAALGRLSEADRRADSRNVLGGGVGLVCACDIPVAAADSTFGITEVRLGILRR